MVPIRDLLVPAGSKRRSGKKLKSKGGATVHNVGNARVGADADANARYYNNSANESVIGAHYFVDEKEIVRITPADEIAEHTGKRKGNDTTVGVEICDNADGDILTATNNGAELVAKLLREQGYNQAVWKENIFQHNDWSGKDCPYQIRRGRPYNWAAFVAKVNGFMGAAESSGPAQAEKWTLGRLLKVTKPYTRGEDIVTIQTLLKLRGFDSGKIDGIYGTKTKAAVIAFQRQKGLVTDGIVGRKTCEALGGVWKG